MKDVILKYALQNALKYNGKANAGAVIGKVLSENPALKKEIAKLGKEIQQIVKEVNSMPVEKQKDKLEKLAPELLEEKKHEKKRVLHELENAEEGKVLMRFEPSPSGPLHIGHAFTLGLNSEYCRMYNGKLILRIADTNPENIYEKAYELIPIDAKWVTKNNVKEIYHQSDRLKIYYKYAEELIKKGYAYVCTCKPEDFKEAMIKQLPCLCRDIDEKENLKRWKKMFSGYKEGQAVVRIKTNLNDKNPAMRDWPALRIKEAAHHRQKKKFRVWPLLNFAVAIDDHLMSVTHTIRAKEHMDNEKRQKFIFDYMEWKTPKHLYIGRINFKDIRVSCSKTRPFIEDGTYSGWDDIRLPFLGALKRRGYQPDAFIKYAIDVGVSQTDKLVSGEEFFKALNAFNKEIIDPNAYRYFFIENPKEIVIENAPEQDVEMDLHPDNKKYGRKFKTNDKFYIADEDYKKLKDNKLYRLMDCLNFRKQKGKFIFDSLEYEKYKEKGEHIIHWLPKEKLVKAEVLMPDAKLKKGQAEKGILKLKADDIIQFERLGFCRLDKIEKDNLIFWFAHR